MPDRRVAVANLEGKRNIKMAFPQFAELWKLIDLLVRKDFRQANLVSSTSNTKRNILNLTGFAGTLEQSNGEV